MLSRPIPYFKQEKDYSCGAACVRMALASYDISVSERELRRRMKTGVIFGTRHHQLTRAARAYGLYARTTTKANFEDIARALAHGRIVIVNFVESSASASHLAVVTDVTNDHILLNDPWHGQNFSMERAEFNTHWQSQNRFGKGNWYRGWMLEVSDAPIED